MKKAKIEWELRCATISLGMKLWLDIQCAGTRQGGRTVSLPSVLVFERKVVPSQSTSRTTPPPSPYDEPKRSTKTATASAIYSESSYAPSQSTSRTTPPPSHRAPYRSTDAQKIIIKAVYLFNKKFTNKPISKLVSGVGAVTDGLVLRISTEGLFIDDDVRKVAQRE